MSQPQARLRASRQLGRLGSRRRHALGGGGVALVACLAVPGLAAAAITPGVGVASVKLNDSPARTIAELGKPCNLQKNQGGEQNWLYCHGPIDWVDFEPRHGKERVIGIETGSHSQRTPQHIGVGSSLTALHKAYPKIRCAIVSGPADTKSCWFYTRVHGAKVSTNFVVEKKRVSLVDIGQIGQSNDAPPP